MLTALGAALFGLSPRAHAAPLIIKETSAAQQLTLLPAVPINYSGPGAVLEVSSSTGVMTVDANVINAGAPATTTVGALVTKGSMIMRDAEIVTQGQASHGLKVTADQGGPASINATRTRIETFGDQAFGALVENAGGRLDLVDVSIVTHGGATTGLFVRGAGARLTATGGSVTASGNGAEVMDNGNLHLNGTRLDVAGRNAWGIASYASAPGTRNTISLSAGSRIEMQDGAGLMTAGGDHQFTLDSATITGRAGGASEGGILLHSQSTGQARMHVPAGMTAPSDIATDRVGLNATASQLTGDVLMESGTADIALAGGSTLTGALVERKGARVARLALDASSTWRVRGDSSLATLDNAGTVAFVAPGASANFKTLTVDHYVGGGLLVLNTRMGDDASPTDRLVINGGSTTGDTALRIVNAGGSGGQTRQGIRLVQTVNGGTTTANAFHLDAGSTGFRASSGTLALNGYEYSLARGGKGGVATDWYLTSAYGTSQESTQALAPSGAAANSRIRNISPESGAYVGNQIASQQFFMHGVQDRAMAAAGDGRATWARVVARRDNGMRMRDGDDDIAIDSSVLQMGGDLLHAILGRGAAIHVGVMGGYGEARVRSLATILPAGASQPVRISARGKVSGYSAGAYATVYQDDRTRLGAYADVSLQYGRYTNQLGSELGSARYRADTWTSAFETGYALHPFAAGSAMASLVVQPKVQMAYSRYDAQAASLPGSRIAGATENSWLARTGVRLYSEVATDDGRSAVQPYLEVDWLHRGDGPSVRMGPNAFEAAPMRDAMELAAGVHGVLGKAVTLSAQLAGEVGSQHRRGYGGEIDIGYHW
ncbi:autotransporter outer membrane beta-barrel domain-containing protein [Achromobacter xylosoxidans]|nr:autotransporter outer membrane beta-barrel domain-containing protein [Achromobacter xylosoxidans]MCZ8383724.1 autotransporter outer membrane beta-barrel domain-containing protein [Achromobacter xylosoxidans]